MLQVLYVWILSLSKSKPAKVVVYGLVLVAMVLGMSLAPFVADTAQAAQCGGQIVAKAGEYWPAWLSRPHAAIWVDTGSSSITPPIVQIQFLNERTRIWETVPNDPNKGIAYRSPIGQSGRQFIYGISRTGWIAGDGGRWYSWKTTWRWRVWYAC